MPDVAQMRGRAADLTSDLRAHQAHEADLIYEGFMRDIGVGDSYGRLNEQPVDLGN